MEDDAEPVAQPALATTPGPRTESVWDEMIARGYMDLVHEQRRSRTVLA